MSDKVYACECGARTDAAVWWPCSRDKHVAHDWRPVAPRQVSWFDPFAGVADDGSKTVGEGTE